MINIITPTNRWMNIPYLAMNFENICKTLGTEIQLNLIISPSDYDDWKGFDELMHPFVKFVKCCEIPKNVDPCYFKINYFLKNNPILFHEWYGFVCDDNMLSVGVVERLLECDENDRIAIFSEMRGTNKIDVNPLVLVAEKKNIGVYKTDLCQFFARGSVFKDHIFNEHLSHADGSFIAEIVNKYETKYFPKDYVYFNVLQPGRWNFKVIEHLFVGSDE